MSHYGDEYHSHRDRSSREHLESEARAREITHRTWDRDYVDLAMWWADRKSKDPSTKVGAIIARSDRTILSMGYNGFPRGVFDTPERYNDRELKYKLVVHAEANAILAAGTIPSACTLYSTLFPCNECAKMIIQAGIKRVISPLTITGHRWSDSHNIACMMFAEAGVEKAFVNYE